jgi:hypothetical protein
MMNCTLFTREEEAGGQGKSNRDIERFARKVSGCQTGLLAAFSKPSNVEHLVPQLNDIDIELFRRFLKSKDATLNYVIYRTDRDFLVMSVGRFDRAGQDSLPAGPRFRHGEQGQMGKNPGYYHFTFSYRTGDSERPEEITEVLRQLSRGLQKYSTILTYSAGMCFDIVERMAGADMHDLRRSKNATRRRTILETKRNAFLDAYLMWKRRRTEDARSLMELAAEDLRTCDPSFNFNPE